MELNATRFPFPLPPRTIGEQKAKVKDFFCSADTLVCTLCFRPFHSILRKSNPNKSAQQECVCYSF
jgi:hypothetical protein